MLESEGSDSLPLWSRATTITYSVVAAVVTLTGLAELVYHWKVRTPAWLGYLFQRPESHCVHHQEGLHRYNYSDLPLWDMLFGTFRNPREFHGECGFVAGADRRMSAMFAFDDVNAAQYGPNSFGVKPSPSA